MQKWYIAIIICLLIFLSACGNHLNPDWYPNGVGKDTVYVVGSGKFSLGKTINGIVLSMFKDDGSTGVLLAFVQHYQKDDDKFYIDSKEGICVVDCQTNSAKIFISVDKQYYANLVGVDNAVTYLTSYDDFTDEEKAHFEAMKND